MNQCMIINAALQLHLGNPINRYMHIEVESNAVNKKIKSSIDLTPPHRIFYQLFL